MTSQDAPKNPIRELLVPTRKAAGFSQIGLAEELGVDERTIKRWEKPDGPEDVPSRENEEALLALLPLDRAAFSAAMADARPRADRVYRAQLEDVRDALRALAAEVARLEQRLYDEGVLAEP